VRVLRFPRLSAGWAWEGGCGRARVEVSGVICRGEKGGGSEGVCLREWPRLMARWNWGGECDEVGIEVSGVARLG